MKQLISILLLLALLCVCFSACTTGENRPYEPDTPAPAAHEGDFVSDHGSMRFKGDGKTVEINFDKYLSELTGLPEGAQEANYVFLSGDLPPHGSYVVRYDVAHELKITVGEQSAVISLGIAAADGKSAQSGVNTVTPDRIPMLFSNDEGSFTVLFEKR